MTDLGEQRRSCGAEVVGDEQLGVGVNARWVELPQWLWGWKHRQTRLSTAARILELRRVDSAYHSCEEFKQQGSETPPVTRLCCSGHPADFCKHAAAAFQFCRAPTIRWQVTQGNSEVSASNSDLLVVSPGAQYMSSTALEQISDCTSLHWPKKVKQTFPAFGALG